MTTSPERRRLSLRIALVSVAASALAACATTPHRPVAKGPRYDPARPSTATARATPKSKPATTARGESLGERALGRYKVGAPYEAAGTWYVPAEQPDYDETGIASWYGDEFNGRPTANGERFDMHAISAAHATLPIPSIVEVTNLDNGRSIQVRLNDRGPFKNGRIIDLSRGGAEALGYAAQGTARVRVRYVGPAPLDGFAAQTVAVNTRRPEPAPPPPQAPSFFDDPPPPPPTVFADPALAQGFGVQAGAFADRSNAERVLIQLRSAGPVVIRPIERDGTMLYRVVVTCGDEAAAWSTLERVAGLGFSSAKVVRF